MSDENERKNYAALRLEFAKWKMLGDGSQRAWAEAHGVAEQTVSEWNDHPEVKGYLSSWREHLGAEVAMVARNMLRLALGGGPQAVGAANWVAKVFGLEAPQKLDITGRMTMADFLAKATFVEQPEPDARLS